MSFNSYQASTQQWKNKHFLAFSSFSVLIFSGFCPEDFGLAISRSKDVPRIRIEKKS